MHTALCCLGEGTGMEELIVQDVKFPMRVTILEQSQYDFPHLKTLVLYGTLSHDFASHIHGPRLELVELKEMFV